MGILANAVVDIGGNLTPLRNSLSQAKTMLRGFTGGMGVSVPITIAMGAGGASISGLVAGLGEAAVKAAKLVEATNKIKVTFGPDTSGGILKSVDDLADKFGIVKTVAAGTAANFGLLGKAAGMSAEQSAAFSKEFTKLAIDLASFHFTSHEEAVRKLMSGLEGMPRPLRDFGIFLSETKVKTEAAAMGLVKYGEELSDEAKILARIAIIRREAGVASGDAERSLNRNFEQMKKFWGDLENSVTEFGKSLQGSLTEAIKLARQIGESAGGLAKRAFGPEPGATFGEGAETVLRTARFAATPIPKTEALQFQWDLVKTKIFQVEAGWREVLGLKGTERYKILTDEIARLQESRTKFMMKTLKMPLSLPGKTAEETEKDYWESIKKAGATNAAAYKEAADNMGAGIKKIGSDFIDRLKFNIDNWMALHLKLAGPGMEPTAEFKKEMKERFGKVPIVPRFEREEPTIRGEPGDFGRAVSGLSSLLDKAGRFMARPAEFLAREKEKGIDIKDFKEAQKEMIRPTIRPSELYTDPEEYGRSMVQGALEGGREQTEKEILKTLQDAKSEMTEDGRQIVQTLKTFGQSLGIIPR